MYTPNLILILGTWIPGVDLVGLYPYDEFGQTRWLRPKSKSFVWGDSVELDKRVITRAVSDGATKFSWYRRTLDQGSVYSSVSATMALIFAVILIFDFFDTRQTPLDLPLKVLAVVSCLVGGIVALRMGKDFPKWAGLLGVGAHCLVSAYFVGFGQDFTNAAANMQEMPLMAMYVAWFYPRNKARLISAAYVLIVVLASMQGPYGDLNGLETVREIFRFTIFIALCTELGAHWRNRIDSDAMIDELTGAVNRRGMSYRGELEIERAIRYKTPLSLALIDLDDFKLVNDAQGHSAGDLVLQKVVKEWKNGIRKHDFVCRIGGDEFVLILPHTSAADAHILLLRLRATASHPWSWGVTEVLPDDTPASMTLRADRAMYEHKTQNR